MKRNGKKEDHEEHELIVKLIEAILNLAQLILMVLPCWSTKKKTHPISEHRTSNDKSRL